MIPPFHVIVANVSTIGKSNPCVDGHSALPHGWIKKKSTFWRATPNYPPFSRYRDQCFDNRKVEPPCWRPQCAAPRINFKKSSRCVLVLRLIWRMLQRKDGLPTKPPMPPQIAEKYHELGKNSRFGRYLWGHRRFFRKTVVSLQHSPNQTQN